MRVTKIGAFPSTSEERRSRTSGRGWRDGRTTSALSVKPADRLRHHDAARAEGLAHPDCSRRLLDIYAPIALVGMSKIKNELRGAVLSSISSCAELPRASMQSAVPRRLSRSSRPASPLAEAQESVAKSDLPYSKPPLQHPA